MIIDVENFGNTYVPDPFIEDQFPLPFYDDEGDDAYHDDDFNYGSDEYYGKHAGDVMIGEGFYDSEGNYVSYSDDDFSDCSLNDRINQKREDWGID